MLKIGLTGGIGCGKSTVCSLFQQLGVAIIDADVISRRLVEPGSPVLTQLAASFGADILDAHGNLQRAQLRAQIFADAAKRLQLNDIMHPLVYAEIVKEIPQQHGIYCIIAVPLLFETEQTALVDRILVIDCATDVQLARVSQRDGVNQQQALQIINSQLPREQRLQCADDVIENSNSMTQLAERVKNLHNFYNLLATVRTSPA